MLACLGFMLWAVLGFGMYSLPLHSDETKEITNVGRNHSADAVVMAVVV